MSMANETIGINRQNDNTNFFVRCVKYFMPWKGDGFSEIFRKLVFIGSIALFVASVGELTDFLETDKDSLQYTQQIQLLEPDFSDDVDLDNVSADKTQAGSSPDKKRVVQPWAEKLLKRNKEVVGWIKIPGFKGSNGKEYINFPVVQHDDNEYYLQYNIDNQPYESGSIFADYVVPIDQNGQPDNITIYGHNMRNLGTSFSHLAEYKSGAKFVKKHPIIEFNTIYDTGQRYIIVGAFIGIHAEWQDSQPFDYWRFYNFDEGDYSFKKWINNVKKASWYSCNVKCEEDDDYITLSTCCDEVNLTKWVIVAKKLDESDDEKKIIASYKDKKNKDIYFPQVWRNVWGNEKKYLGWSY